VGRGTNRCGDGIGTCFARVVLQNWGNQGREKIGGENRNFCGITSESGEGDLRDLFFSGS